MKPISFRGFFDGVQVGSSAPGVGPGPGIPTDVLRTAGQNVVVVNGDVTAMSFPDASFDTAFSFTMLHHVPSAALQDHLMAEVARVLRPGGVFVGTDSLYSRM